MEVKQVNKKLGENVQKSIYLQVRNTESILKKYGTISNFMTNRSAFIKKLKSFGYTVEASGNYIIATKNSEVVRFFFTSHSIRNKNYLLPVNLKYEVDYFVFYSEGCNKAYIVGYGMVRNFCKTLKESYRFFNNANDEKLFVPDKWAEHQQINTFDI